jgi:hypothetical protein
MDKKHEKDCKIYKSQIKQLKNEQKQYKEQDIKSQK